MARVVSAIDENVNNGATKTERIAVGEGVETMRILWMITNAGAGADLGATSVKLCDSGRTFNHTLTPVSETAVVYDAPYASKMSVYDVRAIDVVQLSVANAAATPKDVVVRIFT